MHEAAVQEAKAPSVSASDVAEIGFFDTHTASPFPPPTLVPNAGRPRAAETPPRARLGRSSVGAGLEPELVRRVVRSHFNQINHCYRSGLERTPALEGRVTTTFTIGEKGSVHDARAWSKTIDDERVAQCVKAAVQRWRFPRPSPEDEAYVSYTFVLSRR